MSEHGQDTVYTPVFTPPLDGVKRPTQLLRVSKAGKGKYHFDWRDVERYVRLARGCGLRHYEWTHRSSAVPQAVNPVIADRDPAGVSGRD